MPPTPPPPSPDAPPPPKAPPPVPTGPKPPTPPNEDPLKLEMPTGEVGVRNKPGIAFASDSGGTSKAEDTSRAAGYVADLTRTNDPPPGPPIEKSPESFAGQTGVAPPTSGKAPAKATPNTTPPPTPTPNPKAKAKARPPRPPRPGTPEKKPGTPETQG